MGWQLQEFYSEEDCSRGDISYRKAAVFKEAYGYRIIFMQDGTIIEEHIIPETKDNSEEYAITEARNWVNGIT